MNDVMKPTGEDLKRYILNNLDKAIDEGWIQAYYQPVMRTLTGEICGMEALARWNDPKFGIFPPFSFIGILEEERLIHKIDSCMIHNICEDYSRSLSGNERTVPVSFNLSRLDFQLMDVHSLIEEEIRHHKIPKDMLRVEITESMMDEDSETMHDVIDRFWNKGFRVWMDDFGSGYSSLNVLKDYHFDTLKIDMVFLRDFNARSREIVKSIVDMSKRIGVHTLAEGVENAEQLDFLRSIGCEKAQGYHIGRPMPYYECLTYLKEQGYVLESPAKGQYYHDIGRINILSATPFNSLESDNSSPSTSEEQVPIAFVEYSDKKIKYLFANKSFLQTIKKLGADSLEAIEREFEKGNGTLRERFVSVMKGAKETGETVGLDFIRNNCYCFAQVRSIADYPGGEAYLCILNNLSENTMILKNSLLSDHMRSLCSVYEMITLVDLNTGLSETIYSSVKTKHEYNNRKASEELLDYARTEIYPEDRKKFIEFTDLDTIEQRITDSPTHHISSPFRTRTSSGTYLWSLYSFLFDGDSSERRILSCFRRLSPEAVARLHGENTLTAEITEKDKEENVIDPVILWKNFCNSYDTGFFWKDKDRRFLGVNRKFLEFFGFESDEILLGKTDEDMGWHVDPEPYRADEESVLSGDGQTFLVPGSVICNGRIRSILASKMPVYHDGRIVGLMGYFIDATDQKNMDISIKQLLQADSATGTLNYIGLMESLLRYQDSYALNLKDFAVVMFDISHFHLFSKNYGREFSMRLLREVSNRIQEVTGVRGVAGRFVTDHFMVVIQTDDKDALKSFIKEVDDSVEAIASIDGIPCSLYLFSSFGLFSEYKDIQTMLESIEKKLKEKEENDN
ncbi:MAG: EAL domain-containing protein [Lachnospiraceae bacterium]|nr:EAL domain-containing protein [Lachnospiraceae bacterium]